MKRAPAALVAVLFAAAACSMNPDPPAAGPEEIEPVATTVPASTAATAPAIAATSAAGCWKAAPAAGAGVPAWEDATAEFGLIEPLTGMHAHAAAWGDVSGDGFQDLMVGTFADRRAEVYAVRGAAGPAPDRVLARSGDEYSLDPSFPSTFGRTSGAAFADLDGDGDDDLVVSRNGASAASSIYENVEGSLTERPDAGLAVELGGRSVGVLHVDGDELLDLIIVEDRFTGSNSRLYRNLGGLRFSDSGPDLGWPQGVHGLGISTGDLNGDGYTDVFVSGSNRMFVGTGSGLREVDAQVTAWEPVGAEDDVAGSAMGDVDRDGKLDLVVGQHFNSTLGRGGPQPVRLFLNRTDDVGGDPVLEEVTGPAGLTPLPTKAPHVELADINNDGWLDVVTSASAGNGTVPAVFISEGLIDGVPHFSTPDGLGSPQYWVTAPTADVDRDGRLDVLAVEWEPALPSILFSNKSDSGNWLEVSFDVADGGGPGTRVAVYAAGSAGDPTALLGFGEIVASQGYAAGAVDAAHFGLGDVTEVDLVAHAPGRADPLLVPTVAVNQHVRLPDGCG